MTNTLEPITRRKFLLYILNFSYLIANSGFVKRPAYDIKSLIGLKPVNLITKNDYTLNIHVAKAFDNMRAAAKKDGIIIGVVSSFRSYDHQKNIWNSKFNKYIAKGYSPKNAILKIIEYSTLPGTSRHHWGTDLDIIQTNINTTKTYSKIDPLQEKYFEENNVFYPLKLWLNKNAEDFGFYEAYTNKPDRKGFNYEPWHFSYKPLAKNMLRDFLSYNLFEELTKYNIKGKSYIDINFINHYINNYILGINKNLI